MAEVRACFRTLRATIVYSTIFTAHGVMQGTFAARVPWIADHVHAGALGAALLAPGAIGGIAEATSLSVSFGVVTVLCLLMTLSAGMLRPRPGGAPPAQPCGQPGGESSHACIRPYTVRSIMLLEKTSRSTPRCSVLYVR